MALMTDRTLAMMRAQVARVLPETVGVYSQSESVDSYGYNTTSRSLVATVSGRIDPEPNPTATTEQGRQERLINRYVVSLPYGTDLAINYQLDINGKTYEVVQLVEDQSWRILKRCLAVLVE